MNTTTTKREIVKSARAFLEAKAEYSKNFKIYLESLEPLSEKRFWEMTDIYNLLILKGIIGESNAVEKAAGELFRLPHADSKKFRLGGVRRKSPYTFEEALQFANDWSSYKDELYTPLFEIVENRSDDSYGDLLDNLPLLGPKFYARCLTKNFSNGTDFENAVGIVSQIAASGRGMNTAASYQRFILHGENYNGMMLRDAAEEYFAYQSRK
jgi:hypothetical protein